MLKQCIPKEITKNFKLNYNETIIKLETKNNISFAKTSIKRIFAWGYNGYGQLGDGTTMSSNIPVDITNFFLLEDEEEIEFLSIGYFHAFTLTSFNRIFTTGGDDYSSLGEPTSIEKLHPLEITKHFDLIDEEVLTKISSGASHSLAITSKGRLFAWGFNSHGVLFLGSYKRDYENSPIDITHLLRLYLGEKIEYVDAGAYHSAVITSKNRVLIWGVNDCGQIGDNSLTNRNIPFEVNKQIHLFEGETFDTLSLGDRHSSVLTSMNRLFAWGYNSDGQIGDGSTENKLKPVEITSKFKFKGNEETLKIALGGDNSSLLTTNGRVFIWGSNFYGQLGVKNIDFSCVPLEISNFISLKDKEKIIDISLSSGSVAALTSRGRVYTWGDNSWGQLGNKKTNTTELLNTFFD